MSAYFSKARRTFHAAILTELVRLQDGVPSFADKHSRISSDIAKRIVTKMDGNVASGQMAGQTSGKVF